jgi:tetratricopeptide (TPR) repeat protein
MLAVRRLAAVGTVLSLTAVIAASHVWGEPGRNNEREKKWHGSTDPKAAGDGRLFGDDLEVARFAERPLVLYRTQKGETLFAYQLKAKLQAKAARPTDYLVLVDTSASKAQGPLDDARKLAKALANDLGPNDRLALWTINTRTHDLSNGFKQGRDLDRAFAQLAQEFPAGAVNLKDGLAKIIDDGFEGREGRQQAVVFLGDGKSVAGPLDSNERGSLCDALVKKHIGFFSVPVGLRAEPLNLHGLVSGTGGKVVRHSADEAETAWVARLKAAVATPVLYPTSASLPDEVAEFFPTRLPPLRPDVPTLIVGRLKDGAKAQTFDMTVTGKSDGGEEVRVAVSDKVPAAEVENFFLITMVAQWRQEKERPALVQADRALAFAYERNQMARADLLAKADWALEKDKLDVASRLFQQALDLDPNAVEAKNGLNIVEQLRDGKITKEKLQERIKLNRGDQMVRIGGDGQQVRLDAEQLAQAEKKDAPPPPPLAPAEGNPLAEVQARRAVAEMQATQVINDAIRQARRLVETDPDAAHDFLKRTLDNVRTNPDISPRVQASLGDRVERALQGVDLRGITVKRNQAENLSARAAAANRLNVLAQEIQIQNTIRERMRVFHNMMDQAREQQAYRQAQAIRVDLINQGLPVPAAVTAGYQLALNGYNLREAQELRRIREERFLATLLQVEKSHVPFPDEPPVEFPAPAVWKAVTDLRKARYDSTTFGTEIPKRAFELQDALSKPVTFKGFEDPKTTLAEALDVLAKFYNVTFDVNEKAFAFEQLKDVLKTPVAEGTPIPEMRATLGTVLRKVLARVPVGSGATWIIRRDVIEITTGTFASAEKAVRVYPVADLVTPIPIAVNRQSLFQSAQLSLLGLGGGAVGSVFGFSGFGLSGLGLAGIGGLAGLGGLAGIGGIGGLGGLGGIGGLAGIGGGLAGIGGAGGFQQLGIGGGGGAAAGFRGNFQGMGNVGFGGVAGIGGGQLGQFGNLGGQFGLQGGNQSQLLITLIRQVVGRPKDWAIQFDPISGQPINPTEEQPEGLNQENNQLGFYPPSQALVVKASATIHSKASNLITTVAPMGGNMGALPNDRKDPLVRNTRPPGNDERGPLVKNKDPDNKVNVAGSGDERDDPTMKGGRKKEHDPRVIWQDALVKGVHDPSLIIATADYLAMNGKWDHAAEFLKADLRQGIVVEPWVYKSLALALRESGASAEEIERAEVSAADLEPTDAQGFLQAARALANDKNYTRALAFCRQAALLEPTAAQAYADAVGYAELAKDAKAMEWAAGALLTQDWPVNNKQLQNRAAQKLEALAVALAHEGRRGEAQRLRDTAAGQRRRDLIIKLVWQGDVDLDLRVNEPAGTQCSTHNRQTVGGGTLLGDSLAEPNAETYVAAQAYSGKYTITVDRVWGRAFADKAQLKIIRHQGTPEENEQLLTIDMKSRQSQPITITLESGRRREAAYVSRDAAPTEPVEAGAIESPDAVFHQLRTLADPELAGYESQGFRGGVSSNGSSPLLPSQIARTTEPPSANDRTLYQTKVKSFVSNSLDVTAQAVLSADRRFVRLSLTPVFSGVTGVQSGAGVSFSVIPGGGRLP